MQSGFRLTRESGRQQAGRRPAVVLSPEAYNGEVGLAILVSPITNQVKGYPFEVVIPSGGKSGRAVLADQAEEFELAHAKSGVHLRLAERGYPGSA